MKWRIANAGRTFITLFLIFSPALLFSQDEADIIISSENIFSRAPFRECHAATIAETSEGLVVAFFAGTAEKDPDVGIWVCISEGEGWSAPVEVANGIQDDSTRYPCWNPVLYRVNGGPLLLFYKVGPDPAHWWGMMISSADNGRSWSKPWRLPEGILGPVKNKPVMLDDGLLVAPSSTEGDHWQVQMEMSTDTCRTWTKVTVPAGKMGFNAIQPAVLTDKRGRLTILCRSRENRIVSSVSDDHGLSWSPLKATKLPNNNSGIDAVTLNDGRQLLVYNPTVVPPGKWTGPRTPLVAAVSCNGRLWKDIAVLESAPGEYSYPAVIQSSDGAIHIVYTWKRESIRHVVIRL